MAGAELKIVPAAALALSLAVASCSSGPADFLDGAFADAAPAPTQATVLNAEQRAALEEELLATGDRQIAAGSAADDVLPSAFALAAARQEQSAAAQALLDETSAGPVAAGDPRLIPGATPILCADGQPVAADGLCPAVTLAP